MEHKKMSINDLCYIGIFTAIIAVLAQISIPMPAGVPMTLQTFAIPLAGIILGAKRGTMAALIYILLGAFGVPVFAELKGGLSFIVGPTGGFLLSFPLMAFAAGIGADKGNRRTLILGLAAGSILNYLFGMLMFSFVTASNLSTAFVSCVLSFIPTAIIKAVLAGVLGLKIKAVLLKSRVLA